jgi:hypothetical protein
MLLPASPWSRQPTLQSGLVLRPGINWSAGILARDWTLRSGRPTRIGTVSLARNGQGEAASFSGTGTNAVRTSILGGVALGAGPLALLAVFRTLNTTADKTFVGLGSETGGTGNSVFAIACSATNAAQIRLIAGGSSSNGDGGGVAGTVINDGAVHAALLAVDKFSTSVASSARLFLDGRLVQTYATPAIGLSNYTSLVSGGFRRAATDFAGGACDVLWAQLLVGGVTDAVGNDLTRTPWASFQQPGRRGWGLPSAASTPTLSAATVFNITSTTVRPRVTITF